MTHEQALPRPITARPVFWGAAFFTGMFGMPVLGHIFEWGSFLTMAAMIPPMLLLIPLIRSTEKSQANGGPISPAIKRYNRRALIWSFGYVVTLFFSVSIYNQFAPTGPVAWVVAILPALPVLFLLWSMGAYLSEETDEYVRMQQVKGALFATGLLLGTATFWGFLETFKLVPHVPGWMAVPVWAIGLGLRPIWIKVRGE